MSDSDIQFGQTDLTTCDRELIHIPGNIQPYGALLVLDPETLVVRQAAGATQRLLACQPADALGAALSTLISTGEVTRLRQILLENELRRPIHLFNFFTSPDGTTLDISVHQNEGGLILEFEASEHGSAGYQNPLSQVQAMIAAVSEAASIGEFCQSATEQLHRATGYDRVMVYQFLPDLSGSVMAETVTNGFESFIGLHYPAGDIPKSSRDLYLKNWLRILVDVAAVPTVLEPVLNPATMAPLDMSHVTLRSVSPIHLEYLRNMGVQATMTISIIQDGKLWGMIACHHHQSKQLPRYLRAICELFGNMFALQLDARERADALEYRHRSSSTHHAVVRRMADHENLAQGLIQQNGSLLNHLDANGLVVLIDNQYEASGQTPSQEQVRALVEWLDGQVSEGIFVSQNLSSRYPPALAFATEASGILAISASRKPSDYIIWFRSELVEAVRWAGDPTKIVEPGPLGDRLTPRKSFEAWVQSKRHHSRAWTQNEINAAAHMRTSLLEVVLRRTDELARERAIAQQRHALMVAELNHRVKNTLATIQALARYTHDSADSVSSYVHDFDNRIQAMAISHDLLSDTSREHTSLRALLLAQLAPYDKAGNIILDGPDVTLVVKSAGPLGMVVHELATNAAKHGALSASGQISIHWDITGPPDNRKLAIRWRESGGPLVTKPIREGFGTFTLNQTLPYQCGGSSEVRYLPTGVECDIELGSDSLADDHPDTSRPEARTGTTAGEPDKNGPARILVVEDETIIAFMLRRIVTEAKCEVVGPVSRLAKGLEMAISQPLNGALLDVNLAGEFTWPIARVLKDRGIPFVFMTGYSQPGFIGEEFAGVPVVSKPFQTEDVKNAISSMLGGSEASAPVGRTIAT